MNAAGKLLSLCERVLVTVAIAATAIMMLLTSADALLRYAQANEVSMIIMGAA